FDLDGPHGPRDPRVPDRAPLRLPHREDVRRVGDEPVRDGAPAVDHAGRRRDLPRRLRGRRGAPQARLPQRVPDAGPESSAPEPAPRPRGLGDRDRPRTGVPVLPRVLLPERGCPMTTATASPTSTARRLDSKSPSGPIAER